MFGRRNQQRRGGGGMGRILIALVIAGVALAGYFGNKSFNPITNETQHIDLSVEQEVALGLQAAPEMANQFGGTEENTEKSAQVKKIGADIVANSSAGDSDYRFEFHLLADPETINAFALPGGQIFITRGLLDRFDSDDQIAGVLGHEIGHVVGRHGAEHMAKARLTQGLTGAAVMATYDPSTGQGAGAAQMAAMVGQFINLKYGRDDELESDSLGVRFLIESGYDPSAMIRVMEILAEASKGGRQPEFFATHPNPERRIERIKEAIEEHRAKG